MGCKGRVAYWALTLSGMEAQAEEAYQGETLLKWEWAIAWVHEVDDSWNDL